MYMYIMVYSKLIYHILDAYTYTHTWTCVSPNWETTGKLLRLCGDSLPVCCGTVVIGVSILTSMMNGLKISLSIAFCIRRECMHIMLRMCMCVRMHIQCVCVYVHVRECVCACPCRIYSSSFQYYNVYYCLLSETQWHADTEEITTFI